MHSSVVNHGPGGKESPYTAIRQLIQGLGYCALLFGVVALSGGCNMSASSREPIEKTSPVIDSAGVGVPDSPKFVLDTLAYARIVNHLAHGDSASPWNALKMLPSPGALLPFHRIVAFYGNFYSTRMGILGQLPPDQMLDQLKEEVELWSRADTLLPVLPALHYIAVTAQRDPGKDQKYRLRMPDKEIDKVIDLASRIDALVFLDIQVGHSTLQDELPRLSGYLALPNVHLGIDPEYAMKDGSVPGKRVGTFSAGDINYATETLAELVKAHKLPPKILVVHRFKQGMVTDYKEIKLNPDVQFVMHMDGFGNKAKKLSTYRNTITREPVQFSGFKLFYKNDAADPAHPFIMTPSEILSLHPVPVYIQYQ